MGTALRKGVAALPALSLLLYLFLSESPAMLLLFFGALVFHEWGHLCAFLLLGHPVPALSLTGAGMRLSSPLPLLPREELWIALAGPLFNLLAALAALRFGAGTFALSFAAVHFLFALGNLFPFGGSDGERLLSLFLSRFFPRAAARALRFFRALFLSFFFFCSLFLYYLKSSGLCGVIFSLFFLLEDKKAEINVF